MPQSSGPLRGKWLLILALGCVAAGAFYWFKSPSQQQPAKGPGPGMARRAPVVAAPAALKDVNLYLTGLGTVTAERTVTVKSRVDGELQEVLFSEGQFVKQGQLLARIDPRPFEALLAQSQGQLAKDRALLENARLDLTRYKGLAQSDLIARQQYDTQLSLVHQYEGATKTDQGAVDNARLQLNYSRITAPVSGRVGLRLVDPGNMVRATDTGGLVVITQVEPITVVFTIPEDNLPQVLSRVRAGEALPVTALDREQKRALAQGVLYTLDNQIDTSTGTVKLKARFDNTDHALFPNQFVNARLLAATRPGVVTVPSQAVQRGPQGTFVYVVAQDNTASFRTIEIAESSEGETIVAKGLAAGEMVVVDGADRLRDKAPLELRQPAGKPGEARQNANAVPGADQTPGGKPDAAQGSGAKPDGAAKSRGEAKPAGDAKP